MELKSLLGVRALEVRVCLEKQRNDCHWKVRILREKETRRTKHCKIIGRRLKQEDICVE